VITSRPGKTVSAWLNNTFRGYVTTLIHTMSWRMPLALALMLLRSVTQGAQLLLLVPLMEVVGLDVRQDSIGWLAGVVRSAFATVDLEPTPVTVLGAFLFFTVVLAQITSWQINFNSGLQQDFMAALQRRLYHAIANSDWLTFARSRPSDFTHVLTTEIERVGGATSYLLQLLSSLVLVPVYIVLALQLSATMSVLVFLSGAALLVLLRKRTQAARQIGEEMSRTTSDLYSAAIEHLGGMKTVKSYGAEERNAEVFSSLVAKVARTYHDGARNYAGTTFRFSAGSALILSVILFIALEVLELSAASLLLLLFLFNRMIPLFSRIQQSYQSYLNALPAFARTIEMQSRLDAAAELVSNDEEKVELRHGVMFERVSFSYEESKVAPEIQGLDLLVEAGKTTAIVGPSGAGKSTIADLVMGLLQPRTGRVTVDGNPLEEERISSWRAQIGYVAQDTFLFNDTVRANLLWACPEASDEEIKQALKSAAAEGFVSGLPDGLDTVLGDRGVRLSGGERQRLALARALLRRPSLLILDEATSALDSENEKRIQSAIEELHGHTTILVITHRLSTIRGADVIHVLEKGRLVESGDWQTLMNKTEGRFRALCRAQSISENEEIGSDLGVSPLEDGGPSEEASLGRGSWVTWSSGRAKRPRRLSERAKKPS
jgi:ATP-binding cassette subfamily C protein